MYEDAIEFLKRVEEEGETGDREKVDEKEIEEIRRKHPGIPEDFLSYLREVGSGQFRDCQFAVMGDWLCTPEELLGEGVLKTKERFLCFGDNFSGDYSGFLPDENWQVAELWHSNETVSRVDMSFAEYIREQMLMGPNGEDLRS